MGDEGLHKHADKKLGNPIETLLKLAKFKFSNFPMILVSKISIKFKDYQ